VYEDNNVWIGDDDNNRDYEYNIDGTWTGDRILVAGVFKAADMAYDPINKTIWQAGVVPDSCLYEVDPINNVSTGAKICPPFGTSQRGLAFDPLTDTFYSGSWIDTVINHFDRAGTILDSADVGIPIGGLAFNPATGHLFATAHFQGSPDIYVLDANPPFPPTYDIIGAFSVDGLDNYDQAGLAMDCEGDL